MALSIEELVAKVKSLQLSSDQLSGMVAMAAESMSKSSGQLFQLTRGSRSGEEAANAVRTAAGGLNNAVKSLKALCGSCDEFIQNAVK
jgi:hypothetical protein